MSPEKPLNNPVVPPSRPSINPVVPPSRPSINPVVPPSRPSIGVGAVVVKDGSLLMVRRAHDPYAGRWSIPGGTLEYGEYLTDAVRREVLEETGIEVDVGDLLGILELWRDPHYVILDYVATPATDAAPTAGSDASEARWVPLEEVPSMECTPRFVETLRGWGILSADE